MQTFLPYPDFKESASALDYRRLGKQRVETWQLLQALSGERKGWANHPAAKMWTGCETALAMYGLAMCNEWVARGYNDTMTERFLALLEGKNLTDVEMPSWLGDQDFHRSHQSNLIRKQQEFYEPQFPGVPADLEYIWPTAKVKISTL